MPSVPYLDQSLKNNHETNENEGNERHLTIKETIAKNKEIIERTRKILQKQ